MIHERTNTALSEQDREELRDKEAGQVEQIKALLHNTGRPLAFFEVMDMLGFHQDSTKRALSDLTKQDEHKDRHGRPFAIYDKNNRKNNPHGKTCGTYRFNPDYGKSKTGGQSSMFGGGRCAV